MSTYIEIVAKNKKDNSKVCLGWVQNYGEFADEAGIQWNSNAPTILSQLQIAGVLRELEPAVGNFLALSRYKQRKYDEGNYPDSWIEKVESDFNPALVMASYAGHKNVTMYCALTVALNLLEDSPDEWEIEGSYC